MRRGVVDPAPLPTAARALALTAAYGLCMGLFARAHRQDAWLVQLLASSLKLPVLTALVFVLTCPVFFLANTCGGLNLSPGASLRLCLATFGVFAAILGLLAPAIAMLSFICNYSFFVLINLAFFAAAGVASVAFLLRSVRRQVGARAEGEADPASRSGRPMLAFTIWAFLYGLTGAQLGWMARPFIGWRESPFHWLRGDSMTLWEGIASEVFNIITSGGV